MSNECIFCRIAAGEIPSATLYEDERFRVIFDLSPATRGHALILPKEHCRNVFDLDEMLAAQVFVLAGRVARAMKAVLGCDGVNIVQNNEEVAGQTVFHFHMHVIPRYDGDGQKIGWQSGTTDPEELKALAAKFQLIL